MLTVSLPDSLRVDDSNAVYMLMDCGDNAGFSQRDIADGYIWHYLVAGCHTTGGAGTRRGNPGQARAMFATR
jgi:hypothetical protein